MVSTQVDSVIESAEFFDNKLKWMNSREAAIYLRISVGHLRNLVCKNQVRCFRFKTRLRFLRSDLESLLTPTYQKRR
ncbi:MAG: helix-turn-helix domain-containing protein [Xanthomonadaceae bacterium]|nr:helix-turn-helix domain-containing protein [Xanthomonadaceae bacterium]